MALERWAGEQDKRGNSLGAKLARLLASDYGDIPFPGDERQREVKRFVPEVRKALEKKGYLFYTLTGQSLNSLRDAGKPFWSSWPEKCPDFDHETSKLTEVAIDPKQLFLPGSNGKTPEEQLAMVGDFSKRLSIKINGVEAILGTAADYAELAFAHLDATEQRLFGEKYGYDYTRTTSHVGGSVADVGCFDAEYGLSVSNWDPDDVDPHLWVSPLVVPAGTG